MKPTGGTRYLESIVSSFAPVTGRLLGCAAVGALAILFGAAALVGANPASTDSISPAVLLPARIQSGLERAARSDGNIALAPNHVAYVRRPASVTERRFVAGSPPATPPAPPANPGSRPSADPSPSAPPRAQAIKPIPVPDPDPPPPPPDPVPDPEPTPSPEPEQPSPQPPPVVTPPDPAPPALVDAGFEDGLQGWNTAGVGDVVPRVATDIVRDGTQSSAVRLTGEQDRSELILGGNGSGSTAGTVRFHEGDEYFYGFSFYIETMVYGGPGAHNLIMQFKSADSGSPNFGLQLWDYEGDDGHSGGRGLWSHGNAMGGDRFLSPVPEQVWHDVVIHFRASSVGAGFYEVYLDGVEIDSRSGVSMIVPGAPYAYIKDGLYRNGEEIPGTSEIRLDAAKLGDTFESVLP
ncbi:MAG TPA: heparin lyase I family protein [Solirubrobacterales bacterium]|nr:heparin lyase I family protein [Solirubrobacterales bacterium]